MGAMSVGGWTKAGTRRPGDREEKKPHLRGALRCLLIVAVVLGFLPSAYG